MPTGANPRQLSTAEERRETVLRTPIHAFASEYLTRSGEARALRAAHAAYFAEYAARLESTSMTDPAEMARYPWRLDQIERDAPNFRMALQWLSDNAPIESTLRLACFSAAAANARGSGPAEVLDALGEAYARLIVDRDLLMVLMQANCATSEPAIREAVRAYYAKQVEYVRAVSGAADHEIQRFFATGLLCNLLIALDGMTVDAPWAATLGAGIRHF